jgi:hypothetical protein
VRISLRKSLFSYRTLSMLLIASIFSSLTFGSQTYASDTPVNHTEEYNSYSWGSNTVYAASSIGFMGAEWSSSRQAWAFTYRFVGTGSARFGDDPSQR